MLLTVGFYALALGMVAAMVGVLIYEIRGSQVLVFPLLAFCGLGAFAILHAIMPRRDRFEPPGPALARDEHPRLFAVLEGVARRTSQEMPSEVYLIPASNAWVMQRGGIMGIGSRRVMGLGLPLLQRISIDEMRAIIAHEFGHYVAGDTALGPWIFRTRAAIGRTLAGLVEGFVFRKPFEWYGAAFLRVTQAISRRQEYAADALAAHTVGAAPLATGLATAHTIGAAFAPFWQTEVAPLLEQGYRAPLRAGFEHFLAQPAIASQLSVGLERELHDVKTDPYDSHPPLSARLAALGVDIQRVAPDDGLRAITLLDSEDRAEEQLLAFVRSQGADNSLVSIRWEDVGARVWSAAWRNNVRMAGRRLDGITPARIPALVADVGGTASMFGFARNRLAAEATGATENALQLLGCALAVLLLDHHWTVSTLPGAAPAFTRQGRTLTPFDDLAHLGDGRLSASEWEKMWRNAGLLEADLGAVVEIR